MATAIRHHWQAFFTALLLLTGGMLAFLQQQAIGNWFIETSRQAGFVLNRLDVTGYERTSRADILAVLDIDSGMPLLGIDLQSLKERVESLPWVKTALVTRTFPGHLAIDVIEREPYALWQHEGRLRLIDPAGNIILGEGLAEFSHLLMIVGKTAAQDLPELLALLNATPALAAQVSKVVRVSERRWDLVFKSGIRVKLPDNSIETYDTSTAWMRFSLLEEKHRLLAREVSVIDLRLPDRLVMRVTPTGRRMMEGREWAT